MAVLTDGTEVLWQVGPLMPALRGAFSLEAAVGQRVKELKALGLECNYSPGASWLYRNFAAQWQVYVKLAPAAGNGGGPGGGGPGEAATTAEFEGFIAALDAATLRIEKEGAGVTASVSETTRITLNGRAASLADLAIGDQAKVLYDPSTSAASRLVVQR